VSVVSLNDQQEKQMPTISGATTAAVNNYSRIPTRGEEVFEGFVAANLIDKTEVPRLRRLSMVVDASLDDILMRQSPAVIKGISAGTAAKLAKLGPDGVNTVGEFMSTKLLKNSRLITLQQKMIKARDLSGC
jgi:hypothetical protein